MTRSLIAVDDLLVHQCVDDRDGLLVGGLGRFFVLARDGRRFARIERFVRQQRVRMESGPIPRFNPLAAR